jgi:hypothetical protein
MSQPPTLVAQLDWDRVNDRCYSMAGLLLVLGTNHQDWRSNGKSDNNKIYKTEKEDVVHNRY